MTWRGFRRATRRVTGNSAETAKEQKVSCKISVFPRAAKQFWLPIAMMAMWASLAAAVSAQTWTWTPETVDKSGKAMKIKVDTFGNVHLSYGTDDGVWKYAFQAAGTKRWDSMDVGPGGVSYLDLTLDKDQNPVMCETFRVLRYAKLVNAKWIVQELDTDGAPSRMACG
jgi:hypothetical protein